MASQTPIFFLLLLLCLTSGTAGYQIGCEQIDFAGRELVRIVSAGVYDAVNLTSCELACLQISVRYAFLTAGSICLCSSTFTSTLPQLLSTCSTSNHSFSLVGESPLKLTNLSLTHTTSFLPSGATQADFTLEWSDAPGNLVFQVSYADEDPLTNLGTSPYTSPFVFSHVYPKPGLYLAYVQASEGSMVSTAVEVVRVNVERGLECPPVYEKNVEMECNITIDQGSLLNTTLDLGDSTILSFVLFGNNYHGAGLPLGNGAATRPPGHSPSSTTFFNPSSQFQEETTLYAVSFVSLVLSGTFNLLIIGPACSTGSYCISDNTCTASLCTPWQFFCTNFFCPKASFCQTTFGGSCPNRYASTPDSLEYLQKIPVTISSAGFNYQDLPTPIVVPAGTIIGIETLSTVDALAVEEVSGDQTPDFKHATTTNTIDPISSSTATNYRHLVQVVSYTQALHKVYHTYTTFGIMNIVLKIDNPAGAPFVATTTTIIASVINDSTIIHPSFYKTNTPLLYTLLPHTGNNITYTWNVGDGTPDVINFFPNLTHTYLIPGCFQVNLTSANPLNSVSSNVTTICLEDELIGLTVDHVVSAATLPTIFTLRMTQGSHYLCDWDLDDGTTFLTDVTSTPIGGVPSNHTYASDGAYNVKVFCHNNVSNATFEFVQHVQWPIVNLRLVRTSDIALQNFYLEAQIDQGTNPFFNMTFNGTLIPHTYNPTTFTSTSTNTLNYDSYPYDVEVHAWNLFNDEVVREVYYIEYPITNPWVLCSKQETPSDVPVTFKASVSGGSGIKIAWDFGDNNPYTYEDLPGTKIPATGLVDSYDHTFTWGSLFQVNTSISNALSSHNFSCDVIVYGKIENVTLLGSEAVNFMNGMGNASFFFVSDNTLVNHKVSFNFDDSSPRTTLDFLTTSTYDHTYLAVGTYNVMANISNKVNWGVLSRTVVVAVQISNMQIITSTPNAVVGVAIEIGIALDNSDGVTLYFDFGDPASGAANYHTMPRTPTYTMYEADSHTHTYTSVGIYTITLTAQNVLGNTTLTYLTAVQHPVTPFQVSVNNAVLPPGIVTFTVTLDPTQTLPTEASLTLYLGDGTIIETDLVFISPPYTLTLSHAYVIDDLYDAVIVIHNLASNFTVEQKVGVYVPFKDFSFTTTFRSDLEPGSPSGSAGLGDGTTFPLSSDVIINPTFSEGKPDLFTVVITASNGLTTTLTFDQQPISFNYKDLGLLPGDYNIQVTAVNGIDSATQSIDVSIVNALKSPSIQSVSTSDPSAVDFQLTFEDISNSACLVIDFGDGTKQTFAMEPGACLDTPWASIPPIIVPAFVSPLSLPTPPHKYSSDGTYVVKLAAIDITGTHEQELLVAINSDGNCLGPVLSIKDIAKDFLKPLVHQKSLQLDITSITDIQCDKSLKNVKMWTVWMLNETTGKQMVRLSEFDSDKTAKQAQLTIAPNHLDYAIYKLIYNVTVPSAHMFNYVHTFVKIMPSNIIAYLLPNGMSHVVRSYHKNITLSPETFSYDPDLEPGSSQMFTGFKWFCKQRDEVYKLDYNGSLLASPAHPILTSTQFQATNQRYKGGCFGSGPGALDFKAGTLTFATSLMQINNSYHFTVIVYKGERLMKAELLITLVDGYPPSISVGCYDKALCTPETGRMKINPTNRLTLKAECTENCVEGWMWKWHAYRLGLNDAWLNIINFQDYVIGIDSNAVAVSSTMFTDFKLTYEGLKNYKFEAVLSPPPGQQGYPGKSSINVVLNSGPTPGNCTFSPSQGIATYTFFSAKCAGWTDDDGIKIYKLSAASKSQPSNTFALCMSDDGVFDSFKLPTGNPDLPVDEILLQVEVVDGKEMKVVQQLGSIKLAKMSEEMTDKLFSSLLSNLTTTNNLLTQAANGDVRQAASVFSMISDSLNNDFLYKTSEASGGTVTSETDLFAVTSSLIDDVEYQKRREERSQLRSKMIDTINQLTIYDVHSIGLVASTLEQLTKIPSEINRKDQKTLLGSIDDIVDMMDGLSGTSSLEQVLDGAFSLLATVGNVMESVMFIQEDGTISDIEDAKLSPFYEYETNWDSDRKSFINLPKEKAKTGLQRETNTIVQKNAASDFIPGLLGKVKTLNKVILSKLVAGEDPIKIDSASLNVLLVKKNPSELSKSPLESGGASLKLPPLCSIINCGLRMVPLGCEIITTRRNIFSHLSAPVGVANYSAVVTINLYDDFNKKVQLRDLKVPVELKIPRFYMPPIERKLQNQSLIEFTDQSTLLYYRVNVSDVEASISMQLVPTNQSTQYLVFLRYQDYPVVNGSKDGWDYMQNLPLSMQGNSSDDDEVSRYTLFVNDDVIKGRNGTWYIGVRQLEEHEIDKYNDDTTPSPLPLKTGQPTGNFSVLIFNSGCHFCSEDTSQKWINNKGCLVSSKTNVHQTTCLCNHLTSFGGGFAVQPNTLDFDFIFKNLDFMKNPTLYITEIVIAVLFTIGFIWARYQDKKDVEKLGVSPLPDNYPKDRYLYEVTVSTGMRRNAGTKSEVSMILSGDLEETEVRTLERGAKEKRMPFMRGSTDLFLMTVPRPLGALNYMRIWHDNKGKGRWGGWYLNWVLVRDIQTQEKYHFVVNQWLAVEEDDGEISRLVTVCSREQLLEAGHAFSKRATKGLNDEHIWFSIFGRPPQSRFTRTQRLSCCLCLLFTAMFANALFYGQTDESAPGLSIGPFLLSGEQVYVGMISNLIVFPVNFLIAFLFKNSRPRKKRPSRIVEALKKMKEEEKERLTDESKEERVKREQEEKKRRDVNERIMGKRKNNEDDDDDGFDVERAIEKNKQQKEQQQQEKKFQQKVQQQQVNEPEKILEAPKKKKFELPWWCVIIGWVLLILTVAGCVLGVTFYGIMFQDVKCKKWISSMMISFVSSVLFAQPIKVVLLALLISMIFKKPSEEEDEMNEEDEEVMELQQDEEWMHAAGGRSKVRKLLYQPPDQVMLNRMREKRLNEIKMFEIIREIAFYAIFIYVLIAVSYDFRDVNSYNYKTTLKNKFIFGGHYEPSPHNSIELVKSMDNFWSWLEGTFVKGIRVDRWYNGDPPIGLRGYLDDTVSRVMGFSTLRQLRIRKSLCKVENHMREVMHECNVPYSIMAEDRSNYGAKWSSIGAPLNQSYSFSGPHFQFINETISRQLPEFTYRTASQLDGFPFMGKHATYSGGGYLVELRGDRHEIMRKVKKIKEDRWIDQYTRAIFIEFATYNSQLNLFGVGHIVAELLVTGGFDCYYRIDTMNLLGALDSSKLVQTVLQIIFLVFIFIFIVREVRAMIKQKGQYFKQFWTFVEWCIIIMSIVSAVMYVLRGVMTNRLTKIFAKSGGNAYMKFTGVAYWHDSLLQIISILVFWSTLKFLKLLRFNKTIGLLSSTLKFCAVSLTNFTIMFGVVFFAFVYFFYLLYLPTLEVFSDLIFASQQCLMMMVGKFNFSDMATASPVLGTLFFFLYMVTVFFILMTMFVGIICDAFAAVREDVKKRSNEHEVVDFVVDKVYKWTGLTRMLNSKVKPGSFKPGKPVSKESLDAFPERLDRMLEHVTKVYFGHDQFEDSFKNGTELDGKKVVGKSGEVDGVGEIDGKSGSK